MCWKTDEILNKLYDSDLINCLSSLDRDMMDDFPNIFTNHKHFFVPTKKLARFGRAMGVLYYFLTSNTNSTLIELTCGTFLNARMTFQILIKTSY